MRLPSIFERLFKKKEDEIPVEWYKQAPAQPVDKPVGSVWPPKPSVKVTAQHMRRVLRVLSKILFVVYGLLAVMSVLNFQVALILIVPTLMVVLDYIRNQKIMEEIQSWWDPGEYRNSSRAERAKDK